MPRSVACSSGWARFRTPTMVKIATGGTRMALLIQGENFQNTFTQASLERTRGIDIASSRQGIVNRRAFTIPLAERRFRAFACWACYRPWATGLVGRRGPQLGALHDEVVVGARA